MGCLLFALEFSLEHSSKFKWPKRPFTRLASYSLPSSPLEDQHAPMTSFSLDGQQSPESSLYDQIIAQKNLTSNHQYRLTPLDVGNQKTVASFEAELGLVIVFDW